MTDKKQDQKELGQDLTSDKSQQVPANYADIDWLKKNAFRVIPDQFSSKYDPKREPEVQEGLDIIIDKKIDINPLVILLSKWWEHKTARSTIKAAIDAEASMKNIAPDVYLQQILRKPVDELAKVQNAINRARYAINYFKPRGGVGNKPIFVQVKIQDSLYNVDSMVLSEAKLLFPDKKDVDKLRKALLDADSTNKAEMAEEL